MKLLFIIITTCFLFFSCKKENPEKLPEYYITFNDGNVNKTFNVLSCTTDELWTSTSSLETRFWGNLSCTPTPGPNVGSLADFNFAISILVPVDSIGMITKFKTGTHRVIPYNQSFGNYLDECGILNGFVKYNSTTFYNSDNSNNSTNSYNNIKSIKYLDRVFDQIFKVYKMRFVVEGEYKMNVKQYSGNDRKIITGKYRVISERVYTEFKN